MDLLQDCPVMFQSHVAAMIDVRATYIGGEFNSVEIHSQDGLSPTDWRLDLSVEFRPHRLPDDIAKNLDSMMRDMDLLYGAIDLRVTPEGNYVFLEVNSGGQFLFAELLSGTTISERLAEFLLSS